MSWNDEWRAAVYDMTELDRTASQHEVRSTYYGVVGDRYDDE